LISKTEGEFSRQPLHASKYKQRWNIVLMLISQSDKYWLTRDRVTCISSLTLHELWTMEGRHCSQ
jgi:hypothetical protein